MEQLNFNHILNRKEQENKLIEHLDFFEKNKKNLLTRRGIYVYGLAYARWLGVCTDMNTEMCRDIYACLDMCRCV